MTRPLKHGILTDEAPAGATFQIGQRVHARGMIDSRYGKIKEFYVRNSPQTGFCYVLTDGGFFGEHELTAAR